MQNNNKFDAIKTGRIVIADLFPRGDLEKCMYTTLFYLTIIKLYRQ